MHGDGLVVDLVDVEDESSGCGRGQGVEEVFQGLLPGQYFAGVDAVVRNPSDPVKIRHEILVKDSRKMSQDIPGFSKCSP